MGQNDYAQAAEFFNSALKQDGKLPGPRFRLAKIALDAGRSDDAGMFLQAECKLDIQDSDVLLAMGSMLFNLGEIDYATDCFLRIVDEDDENIEAFCAIAVTLSVREQFEGALQFFEHAVTLGFESPDLFANTAFLYLETGKPALAAQMIAKARSLEPGNTDTARLARRIKLAIFSRNIRRGLEKLPTYRLKLLLAKYRCRIRYFLNSRFSR